MNTVTASLPAEPHLVTTVTNMRSSAAAGREVQCGCRAGVPTLVTNRTTGGGRTNPAGPQEEEEEEETRMTGGAGGGGGNHHLNLLHFSSDEEEPLLSREQLPAESEPPLPPPLPQNRAGGQGSNSNNNNNRPSLGSKFSRSKPEPPPETRIRGAAGPFSDPEQNILFCGPAALRAPPTTCDGGSGAGPYQEGPETGPHTVCSEPPGFQTSQEQNPAPEPLTSDTSALDQKPSSSEPPGAPEPHPGASFVDIAVPKTQGVEPALAESVTSELAEPQNQALDPQIPGPLQVQLRQSRTRRPERPSSLDLSSSCLPTGGSSSEHAQNFMDPAIGSAGPSVTDLFFWFQEGLLWRTPAV